MATLPALTNTDTTLLARLNIRVTLPLYLGISGPLVCMHEGGVGLFPGGARGLFRVCYTSALLLRIPDPTCTQCIISGTPKWSVLGARRPINLASNSRRQWSSFTTLHLLYSRVYRTLRSNLLRLPPDA